MAALGHLNPGLGTGQRVLCNVDTRLEKLLRALGEEGLLDLLLLAGACSVVVLLRAEETVDLAIGLEPDHEGSEAVVALHFALAESTEAGLHGHGVGAAPLEELLHRLLVSRDAPTRRDGRRRPRSRPRLRPRRRRWRRRDGDGSDWRVDGERSHGRSGGRGPQFFLKKIAFPQFGNIATEEKHEITLESDDIMLHIYLYLSFL